MKGISCLKEFLFGRPSRKHEIELAWKKSVADLQTKYNKRISALERTKMDEIGFPFDAPRSIDEKKRRLEKLDSEIQDVQDEMYAMEDELFFKMLSDIKSDEYASATCIGRLWLWVYWHV